MPEREFLNPESLPKRPSYTQVVTARGGKLVFIAGQVATAAGGADMGGTDLRAQARQAYSNLKTALAAAGATFADVVKLNTYVVDYNPTDLDAIRDAHDEFIPAENRPVWTLVGVQSLARREYLIEIEAIAVVD
jgi:enamine deaminase RidA (YjgF/YER057c/UK114 family)